MTLDTAALAAAAEAAADVAGAVIRPFFRAGIATDQKTDRSPVTGPEAACGCPELGALT